MAIKNDEELAVAVASASVLLQQIQNYAGRNMASKFRVKFPYGFIRGAQGQRLRLSFIKDDALKNNAAYTLILSDVIHWLLARTEIVGTAREMLSKNNLFLLGALVESFTKVALRGKCGSNYAKRLEYLRDHQLIDAGLFADLSWLWDVRNKMHLFQVTTSEYNSADYMLPSYNRAVRAFQSLLDVLNKMSP